MKKQRSIEDFQVWSFFWSQSQLWRIKGPQKPIPGSPSLTSQVSSWCWPLAALIPLCYTPTCLNNNSTFPHQSSQFNLELLARTFFLLDSLTKCGLQKSVETMRWFSSFPDLVFVSALQDPLSLQTAFKLTAALSAWASLIQSDTQECDLLFYLPLKYSRGAQESQLSQL